MGVSGSYNNILETIFSLLEGTTVYRASGSLTGPTPLPDTPMHRRHTLKSCYVSMGTSGGLKQYQGVVI